MASQENAAVALPSPSELLAPHNAAIKAHSASYWAERVANAFCALTKAQTAALLTEADGFVTVRSERMGKTLFDRGLTVRFPQKWDAGVFKLTELGREVAMLVQLDAKQVSA